MLMPGYQETINEGRKTSFEEITSRGLFFVHIMNHYHLNLKVRSSVWENGKGWSEQERKEGNLENKNYRY